MEPGQSAPSKSKRQTGFPASSPYTSFASTPGGLIAVMEYAPGRAFQSMLLGDRTVSNF